MNDKKPEIRSKNLLLVFTRNPELGKTKTRLAKSVGDETALEIYKFLLNKTKEVIHNLLCDKAVYYSIKIRNNDIWDDSIYQKEQQKGADLGFRMKNAFQNSFVKGYEKVIIVGSDLYDLTPNHINEAFSKLETYDVVIGPAKDGGYYLLGMNTLQPNIFENKNWGTSSVRKETLNDLQNASVYLLDELNDVDVIEDIENHELFQQFL